MNVIQGAIVLILTVVTPPGNADLHLQFKEPSVEQCLADAKDFLGRGIPKELEGAKAIMAACLVPTVPEEHSSR